MTFTPKFNVGDHVYRLFRMDIPILTECPSCVMGKLTLKDGKQLDCPNCLGKIMIQVATRSIYRIEEQKLIVIGYRLEVRDGKEDEEVYHTSEDGGSGSYSSFKWSEIFGTLEGAEAEVSIRNKNSPEYLCGECYSGITQYKILDERQMKCLRHDRSWPRHYLISAADKEKVRTREKRIVMYG